MNTAFPQSAILSRGQAWHFHAPQGLTILAMHGDVCIRLPPAWLADSMVVRDILLREGEAHELQDAGWIAVVARTDAQLKCEVPHREHPVSAALRKLQAFGRRRLSVLRGGT